MKAVSDFRSALVYNGKGLRGAGFTAIEMMIVLAVIAILAAMAAPSMSHQIVRQQIEAALPLTDIAKAPIAAQWRTTQSFPADNAEAGLPVAGKIVSNYVSRLDVAQGSITVTFGNHAHSLLKGKHLTLRPAVVVDTPIVPVEWVCAAASAPTPMTVFGNDQTDVPKSMLPRICQ